MAFGATFIMFGMMDFMMLMVAPARSRRDWPGLTGTCGDDDHVGVTADLRVIGTVDGDGGVEAGAVLHVEDFGFDVLLGDVFEDDLTGDTALGGGEGERGTDCAGTDDGELCGLNG